MAYQKFAINLAAGGDNGDNGDKSPESPQIVATVAAVTKGHAPEKNILHLADIMALPIMPCTTCSRFKWGRRPSCTQYANLDDPRKGCRCVHYQGRLS